MINPMNLWLAKAVKLLIQPRGEVKESEVYEVYKHGKQLTLVEIEKEIEHLEEMDRRSATDLEKGMVG
jgi:hypothetical protein|tara:strand:- start:20 stop:223 length:204 start_codon:yes stop_codon:yes gene_type:complete